MPWESSLLSKSKTYQNQTLSQRLSVYVQSKALFDNRIFFKQMLIFYKYLIKYLSHFKNAMFTHKNKILSSNVQLLAIAW